MKAPSTFLLLFGLAAAGGLAAWILKDRIKTMRKPDPQPEKPRPAAPALASAGDGEADLLRQALGQVLQQDPWILEGFLVEHLEALNLGLVARAFAGVQRDPGRSPVLTRLVARRLVEAYHPLSSEGQRVLASLGGGPANSNISDF